MANTLEKQSSFASRRHILDDEPDFSLKEWSLKARIARENPNSRRFSASNLKSFREDTNKSFRSNVTISSTASSPGYTLREEIDPSTYSFTTALKALQAKTVYTWEYLSGDGLTLNSKWSDAEKYISNPLSGEVPLECLSAKTLSARSFRSRITMSAPLIYPSQMHNFGANSPINEHVNEPEITSKEKKRISMTTRDVGTQSTPPVEFDLNSTSPSPAPPPAPVTPSIQERSLKLIAEPQNGDPISSPLTIGKLKSQTEVKEVREKKEYSGGGERKKHEMMRCRCRCLSLLSVKGLWMRTITRKTTDHTTKNTTMPSNFLSHFNACSKE